VTYLLTLPRNYQVQQQTETAFPLSILAAIRASTKIICWNSFSYLCCKTRLYLSRRLGSKQNPKTCAKVDAVALSRVTLSKASSCDTGKWALKRTRETRLLQRDKGMTAGPVINKLSASVKKVFQPIILSLILQTTMVTIFTAFLRTETDCILSTEHTGCAFRMILKVNSDLFHQGRTDWSRDNAPDSYLILLISNLGLANGYPDWGFSLFSSASPGECLGHDSFL
jgi:hypothetical protein